jgi:hypothetical protein
MGQFKPMIKMETTEPSVELKLKKGGHVSMKHSKKHEHGHKTMEHHMDGGMTGMMPRGVAPAMAGMAPKRPAMAMRRRAMTAMPTPMMKKGGMAKGGEMESKHQQMMEDKRMAHLEKMLKKHESMPAHLAHKGMASGGSMEERMKNLAKAREALHKCKTGGGMHHLDKCEEHLAKCGGGSMKKMAKGGKVDLGKKLDQFETMTTIEHDEKPYVKTKMHEAKRDTVHGTGEVKEGNAGGFKHGGKVHHISGHPEGSHEHHKHMAKHHAKMHKEGGSAHHHKMHEHHKHMAKMAKGGHMYAVGGTVSDDVANKYEETMMHDGEYNDSAHGTGGVSMSNAGGYKKGGKTHHKYARGGHVMGAEDNVTTTPKGKTHTKTGEVHESNAGGFKKGGALKKHFAMGGSVNNTGRAMAMPQGQKPASKPVHINQLSGTFKKGGKVMKFSGEEGSAVKKPVVDDLSKGAYDKTLQGVYNEDMDMAKYIRNIPHRIYQGVKDITGMGSTVPAGSVTKTKESVTVAPQKKRGGSVKHR